MRLIFWWLLILMVKVFCVAPCTRWFTDTRELHIHQSSCAHVKAADAASAALAQSAPDALSSYKEKMQRKKRKREEEAAAAQPVAGPSFDIMDTTPSTVLLLLFS
jgi:hypothetical protein